MQPADKEVSEEFKEKVDQFLNELLNYEELTSENKALYDIIADICEEEGEDEK